MNSLQSGIWSGILATGPMTLAMFAMQKELPREEQSPLPPATLARETVPAVADRVSSARRQDMTLLAHFAYGIACASAYALVSPRMRTSPTVKGGAFGLLIWTLSYLGWTPALGYRASAYRMPWRRNALMIGAHIVWGVALGYSEAKLRQEGSNLLDGRKRAPAAE